MQLYPRKMRECWSGRWNEMEKFNEYALEGLFKVEKC
jgi:hypothetical protein